MQSEIKSIQSHINLTWDNLLLEGPYVQCVGNHDLAEVAVERIDRYAHIYT